MHRGAAPDTHGGCSTCPQPTTPKTGAKAWRLAGGPFFTFHHNPEPAMLPHQPCFDGKFIRYVSPEGNVSRQVFRGMFEQCRPTYKDFALGAI
jgi:hypothetical protein